jgi:putative FmdB family regulatory protein
MPVYDYRCDNCDKVIPKTRGIKEDDPGYECETCTLPLVRVYSNFGVVLNGPGFYSTDNRKR